MVHICVISFISKDSVYIGKEMYILVVASVYIGKENVYTGCAECIYR